MTDNDNLQRLCRLSPAAFESLVQALSLYPILPGTHAPLVTRAIDLLQVMKGRGEAGLELLLAELQRAEQLPPAAASQLPLDGELEDVKHLLETHDYELAWRSLIRIEQRGIDVPASRRIRILSQKAYVHLAKGDADAAADEYLRAVKIAPTDEKARINEAVAHEFLGDVARAHELADTLIAEFPRSQKAFAVWLRTSALEYTAKAQEELAAGRRMPPDGEIWLAIASRAITQQDFPRAERLARRATEVAQDWPPSWLLLGAAILQSVLSDGESRPRRLSDVQLGRLREAAAFFKRAFELAQKERRLPLQIEALVHSARVHDLLGEAHLAEQSLREADRLKPSDGPLLFCLGNFLREQKRPDESVRHLEQSLRIKPGAQTEFTLALALSARKGEGDAERATELFAQVARSAPQGIGVDALKFAIQGLLLRKQFDAARHLLSRIAPDAVTQVLHQALSGLVSLDAGDFVAASAQAEAALKAWSDKCEPVGTGMLAFLFTRLKRHAEALPLWQHLFDPELPGFETDGLLNAAQHLHRDDILLDACRRLREAKKASPNVQRLEFSLLERYDPAAATELLRPHTDKHPKDYIARLGLLSCELRIGRKDTSNLSLEYIPAAKDVNPRYGEMIVNFLNETGQISEAREYGYQLVRAHYNSMDAHRAFCLSFLSATTDSKSSESALRHVASGTAFAYQIEDSEEIHWIIIEDNPEIHLALFEHSPSHPWIKDIIGKAVGDKIRVPGSGTPGQFAHIKAIQDKYSYRLQDSMQKMTKTFALDSGWAAIRTPQVDKAHIPPETALKPLFDQLDLYNQQDRLAFEMYRCQPLSVHAFGVVSGRSPFEAMFALMDHDNVGIHCWHGTPTVEEAACWLKQRPFELVIDLTALVTMFALDRLELLQTPSVKFLVTQATVEELRRVVHKLRPNPRQAGLLHSKGDAHRFLEVNNEEAQRRYTVISQLLESVVSHCEVQGGRCLAFLEPNVRKMFLKCFGQHGAESLLVAHERKCLLWTDDVTLPMISTQRLNIRRVWTQVVLQNLLEGRDVKAILDCNARLVGWGYNITNFGLSVVVRAAELAMWQPSVRPLKQILDAFASESTNLNLCVQAAAGLIIEVEQCAIVNPSAQATYRMVLENLRRRPGGAVEVRKMLSALPTYIKQRISRSGAVAISSEA